ncbi:MAG: hypothetical protein HYY49_00930 [Ignavibacteriales bacterium]|nr:hypothetical protein [Ignavibacteriales bacterium]
MKRRLPFLILFINTTLHSQPGVKDFSDCDQLQTVMVFANDVMSFCCDTAFVMNKLTFRRYDSAYKDVRRRAPGIANLMSAYDEIIELQAARLKNQSEEYETLRASFASLSVEAQSKIAESSTRLTTAIHFMENLNKDLTETKRLLGEAKEIIEAEKHGLNLEKILWGAGGVAAGIVIGTLIAR